MKKLVLAIALVFFLSVPASAQDPATAQEVYDMVLKGAMVLESLGEEGLQAFNDPKGEFVWKDTYVQVYNCSEQKIAGHINPDLLKWSKEQFAGVKDKRGNPITKLICDASANPNGAWVEYWWPKAGETEPSRKITFVIHVEGTPYQVSAGIYDDKISLEELNKTLTK